MKHTLWVLHHKRTVSDKSPLFCNYLRVPFFNETEFTHLMKMKIVHIQWNSFVIKKEVHSVFYFMSEYL